MTGIEPGQTLVKKYGLCYRGVCPLRVPGTGSPGPGGFRKPGEEGYVCDNVPFYSTPCTPGQVPGNRSSRRVL